MATTNRSQFDKDNTWANEVLKQAKTERSRGHNRGSRVLEIGGMAFFVVSGLFTAGYFAKKAFFEDKAGAQITNSLCKDFASGAKILNEKACSTEVVSQLPLASNTDNTHGVDGVLTYILKPGQAPANLAKIALVVDVTTQVNQSAYSQTAVYHSSATPPELNAGVIFAGLNSTSGKTPTERAANYSICMSELKLLEGAVRNNPDIFANNNFNAAAIANPLAVHLRSDHLPYTSDSTQEIMFSYGSGTDAQVIACDKP